MTFAGDAAAWVGAPTRRRAFGMVFGGLSAVETGNLVRAEALIDGSHGVLGERPWQFFPPMLVGKTPRPHPPKLSLTPAESERHELQGHRG
jgi:hypothetical protein